MLSFLRISVIGLLLLVCIPLFAQKTQGTVRGWATDRLTGETVAGASVEVFTGDYSKGAPTDSSGHFFITGLEPGRYSLRIKHIGYQTQILYNLLVVSGKELVVDAKLSQQTHLLGEVKIRGNSTNPAAVAALSTRVVSLEETMRYAATFNDPVRVLASYPEVIIMNDQANHAVIRGNNPSGLLWKIEGADVVNPNHLTNAGTFSDKPTLTGGGVAIISSQLLNEALFIGGNFPAGYGNVLSGVFDYYLRKGNNRQYEFTGQASLLGLDFAAEGPFSRSGNSSFLINYRYSTIGLFELAGIPVSDEKINFSDLSFNVSIPTKGAGNFTLFGIGGKSITSFEAQRDSAAWEVQKDRTDYDFSSDMGVIGMTHQVKAGNNGGIYTSFAVSFLESSREEQYIESDYSASFHGSDRLDAGKISLSARYEGQMGALALKTGLVMNQDNFFYSYRPAITDKTNTPVEGKERYDVFQPFIGVGITAGKLTFEPALHVNYLPVNEELSIEPRASISMSISQVHGLTASYGLHSMVQHPLIYINYRMANNKPAFTKAHHAGFGYYRWITSSLVMRMELFHQQLFRIPVSADTLTGFSAFNLVETIPVRERLVNNGTGVNYGIEASFEQNSSRGFYYILAGSLYNSQYKGSDGIQRSTRFNGRYHFKITAGKEYRMQGKEKMNTLGINFSAVLAGGMRYTPIDINRSKVTGTTVYHEEQAFSARYSDYFRMDTRITWRKDRKKFTETFFLDIQNLTNHKNTAWKYFDTLTGTVVTNYQLGIIPFLGYRIEF